MAQVDPLVAGPGLPRDRERAFVPVGRYALAINSRSAWSSIESRSRSYCSCGWPHCSSTRLFASQDPTRRASRAHRRRSALLGRRQLRAGGAAGFGSPQERHALPLLHRLLLSSWRASSRPFPASLRSRSSSCLAPRSSAAFAIVEQRTGFNVFDHVRTVLPFLQFEGSDLILAVRSHPGDRIADHPIALGVLLAMCLPLGVALARSRSLLVGGPDGRDARGRHGVCFPDSTVGYCRRHGHIPVAPTA